MLVCSTGLRPPSSVGEEAIVRLASDVGCAGILVGDGCTLPSAAPLVTGALRAGLKVVALAAPLGDGVAATAHKRPPRLGAADRDERAAASELALRTLAMAGSVGASIITVRMGPLFLAARPVDMGRFFRRREVDEGDDGEACLMAALDERRATIGAALDACRSSLDRLVREGERRNLQLALELSSSPWGLPSPREGLDLLAGYEGARLGVVFDPARLSVMRRLGLSISPERLSALRKATLLIADNEAVGLDAGYLPGLGEREDDLAQRTGVPAGTPVVLVGPPDSTDAEIATAATAAAASA
jgi:hypothetical protein